MSCVYTCTCNEIDLNNLFNIHQTEGVSFNLHFFSVMSVDNIFISTLSSFRLFSYFLFFLHSHFQAHTIFTLLLYSVSHRVIGETSLNIIFLKNAKITYEHPCCSCKSHLWKPFGAINGVVLNKPYLRNLDAHIFNFFTSIFSYFC